MRRSRRVHGPPRRRGGSHQASATAECLQVPRLRPRGRHATSAATAAIEELNGLEAQDDGVPLALKSPHLMVVIGEGALRVCKRLADVLGKNCDAQPLGDKATTPRTDGRPLGLEAGRTTTTVICALRAREQIAIANWVAKCKVGKTKGFLRYSR